MGLARFRSANIASARAGEGKWAMLGAGGRGQEYRFTFVDVGNPHCVIQVR